MRPLNPLPGETVNRSSSDSGCIVGMLALILLILLFGGPLRVEVKSTPAMTPTTAQVAE